MFIKNYQDVKINLKINKGAGIGIIHFKGYSISVDIIK